MLGCGALDVGGGGTDGGGAVSDRGGVAHAGTSDSDLGSSTQLVTGVHAFDVMSSLKGGLVVHTTYAGWASPVPLTVPSTQSVTFVLDADALRLLVNSECFPLTTTDGRAFRMKGEFTLWRAASESWVTYDDVSLTVNGDHLVGTAHVKTMDITFQAASDVDLGNATFVGGPDTTAPVFFAAPYDPVTHPFQTVALSPYVDPFDALRLSAGEPLPPPDLVRLRSDSGDTLTLRPDFLVDATVPHETTATSGPGAMSFFTPYVLLRYADHYRLVVDGIADFAGNAAVGLEFDTPPKPPLVPQDGFESASPADGLAGAQVIDGTGLPVITGGKSLYGPNEPLDPQKCFLGQVHGTPFALRLAVPPGATVVRFSYREVSSHLGGSSNHGAAVGVEGGAIASSTVTFMGGPSAAVMKIDLPNGTTAFVGPVGTGEVELPPGVGDEVVFTPGAFIDGCDDPDPTGLIIDDLRVE
jgi:hypothetical protein